MAKKGYNADGSLDRSQTFTNGNTGVTTYGDGSPAPSAYQQVAINQQQGNEAAYVARGYDSQGKPYGPNPRYMDPKTGRINLTSPYQDPKAKAKAQNNLPPALPTGNYQIPTVASRMSQAIQKGITKGKINSNQLDKTKGSSQANSIPYQVPGTNNQGIDINKVYNGFAQQQQTQDNARNVYNQAVSSGAIKPNNGQSVNYTVQSSAAQKALNPVPMPQKTLAPPQIAPRTN